MRSCPPRHRARAAATLAALTTAAVVGLGLPTASYGGAGTGSPGTPGTGSGERTHLYLVTLDGPGTAGHDPGLNRLVAAPRMLAAQQRLLDALGAPSPLYRWTTALDGLAVPLTQAQAQAAATLPDVALVERDHVRPLAALSTSRLPERRGSGTVSSVGLGLRGPRHGGAGEVIGMIDTGIAPRSPLFAQLGSGPDTLGAGSCEGDEDWPASSCNGKVVAGRTFLAGFGAGNLSATASTSPLDTDGHGTQLASIAAGDRSTDVRVAGDRLGRYGGMAPDAAVAAYKACWTAPEPSGDGCSTADLVAAVDAATADGVDVLDLAVGGLGRTDGVDTLDRALLGATEAGIVVVAAAGNHGPRADAAHAVPWVVTVGATTGAERRGRVAVVGGPRLTGAMLSRHRVGPHRLVLAARAAVGAGGSAAARVCTPGSLDSHRVRGAIVVCERGGVARDDKSRAVALAGGIGMVLVNPGRGAVYADVQRVPAVHLDAGAGRRLLGWLARHPHARARLLPAGTSRARPRVARWSPSGSVVGGPADGMVKPDVVAPGGAVLGAVPSTDARGERRDTWSFITGTSAATAYTSGVAASLLARPGWTPARVRSALATTAGPLPGPLLHSGSGFVRPGAAADPGLALLVPVRDYRRWLEGRTRHLDTPSVLLRDGAVRARRTLTNVSGRRLYFSSSAVGFRSDVVVQPAAVVLRPGQSATFRLRAYGVPGGRVDDGYVVWRGATGTTTRVPVVITR